MRRARPRHHGHALAVISAGLAGTLGALGAPAAAASTAVNAGSINIGYENNGADPSIISVAKGYFQKSLAPVCI